MPSSLLFLIVEIAAFLLGLGLFGFAAVVVHEAGHAGAGVLCGFRVYSVRVGPVEAKKEKEWDWMLRKRSLIGGLVRAQLRTLPGPWAAWQCFAFLIAGPMANLLTALILAPFSSSPTVAGVIAGWFTVVSVFFGIVNLIPFKTKKGQSDGAKLLGLAFRKTKRDELVFGFSLIPRIHEVNILWKNHRFQEASDKLDAMMARLSTIPNLDNDVIVHFRRLREILDKGLAKISESSAQNPPTGISRQETS